MGVETRLADILLHNIKLHQNQLYLYSLRLANQKCTRFWRVTTWAIFGEGGASFELLFFYMYHLQTSNPLGLFKNDVAVFHDFLTSPSTFAPLFYYILLYINFCTIFDPGLSPKTKRGWRHLWTAPFKIVVLRSLWIDVKEVHIVKCKLYTIIVNNVFQLFFCKQHLS